MHKDTDTKRRDTSWYTQTSNWCRQIRNWQDLGNSEVGGHVEGAWVGASTWTLKDQRLDALLFDEAQNRYTEVTGDMAGDTLRAKHKAQNLGKGVMKAQCVEATMAFMEKDNVFHK